MTTATPMIPCCSRLLICFDCEQKKSQKLQLLTNNANLKGQYVRILVRNKKKIKMGMNKTFDIMMSMYHVAEVSNEISMLTS